MDWNSDLQVRFDQLRAGELVGTLTVPEEIELAALVTALEAEEARLLSPGLERMRAEQAALRQQLNELQSENEDLAQLLYQQEQLVADARRWLAQFDQRHRQIQQSYARLTGEPLLSPSSP